MLDVHLSARQLQPQQQLVLVAASSTPPAPATGVHRQPYQDTPSAAAVAAELEVVEGPGLHVLAAALLRMCTGSSLTTAALLQALHCLASCPACLQVRE